MKPRKVKRLEAAARLDKPPTVDCVHKDMLKRQRRGLPVRQLDDIITDRRAEAARLRAIT